MQGDVTHAARGVARIALRGHFGHDIRAVLNIGRLAERRVRAAGIVMVAAKDDRADLPVANHFVEFERQIHAPHRILIENAALCTDDEPVLLRVAHPDVVVVVLIAPVVRADIFRGGHVGLVQILRLPAQAAPAERAVAIVKQARAEDILDVGREHKAIQIVFAIFTDRFHAGIVDRLQEAVAVIEEIGAPVVEFADHLIVVLQRFIDQSAERLRLLSQHPRTLGKTQALWAVAAVVRHMAGGLVAHQIDVHLLFVQIFQQIDDIAMVGDRAGLAVFLARQRDLDRLGQICRSVADPALCEARIDAGLVNLGDDGRRAGDLRRLALCARHAAKACRDEQPSGQILIVGNAENQAACVEQRIERTVDDTLRADVHPAARGHLAVIRHSQRGGAVEILLIIECADHQAV